MTGQNVELELVGKLGYSSGAQAIILSQKFHLIMVTVFFQSRYIPAIQIVVQYATGNGSMALILKSVVPNLLFITLDNNSALNASTIFLRIVVETDAQINYGGMASSGWEGIAIDDIAVWTDRGTASQVYKRVKISLNNHRASTVQLMDGLCRLQVRTNGSG